MIFSISLYHYQYNIYIQIYFVKFKIHFTQNDTICHYCKWPIMSGDETHSLYNLDFCGFLCARRYITEINKVDKFIETDRYNKNVTQVHDK
jgi:hypothetical protein